MLPLNSGLGATESVVVLALALVVVAAAFVLTREDWSRVGALLAVGLGTGGSRLVVGAAGVHGDAGHLLGHGLERVGVVVLELAGYYALFDARSATSVDG